MKNYDLKPTQENIIGTLKNDAIRRREYLIRFLSFLDSLKNNSTISIDGDWGNGKTFFVKQIIYILFNTNKFIKYKPENNEIEELKKYLGENTLHERLLLPVYYNAWKNDNTKDPVLSIIKELLETYSNTGKFTGDANTKEGIKKICKSIISSIELHIPLTNKENPSESATLDFSGENFSNIIDSFDSFKKENLLKQIEEQDNLNIKINELFDELCIEKGDKFVIFIDELDRCKPTFAINLLERIKHYFDNEKIIFVFSTNIIQLQNTIKAYYGNDFDSYTYLDKFFDFKFHLPNPDTTKYFSYLGEHLGSSYVDEQLLFIIEHFKLSMRNINHYISTYDVVANHFGNMQGIQDEPALMFCYECVIPILVYLFLFDKAKYKSFMQGNEEAFFAELISNKKNDKYVEDLVKLAQTKHGSETREIGTLKVMYKKIFSDENYNNFYDNSKYKFPSWTKEKLETSMSCFF